MRSYRVQIKTLSPLHLGTGEVYEPTDFFVHRKGYLGLLDFEKFIDHFTEKELLAFKHLCRKGTIESLVKLYLLIDGLAQKLLHQGIRDFVVRKIDLCADFLSHYAELQKLLENPQKLKNEFKRFTIYRTAFSPNEGVPIIPGSAVKGAIRTAVLNRRRYKARGKDWRHYCQQRDPRRPPRCDNRQLESEILEYSKNRFQQDPFRLVKVSDFRPLGEVKTKILYAVNLKKDGGRARGPYQILETIEPGAVFEGEITFLDGPRTVENPLTFEEITDALKSFYVRESEREFDEVSKIGADFPVFPEEGFPLRIGRHSGAESVTIEGFRCILIRGPRGQNTFLDHATTLWLASEYSRPRNTQALKPFGWAVLYEAGKKSEKGPQKNQALDLSKLGKRFKLVVRKHNA